MQASTLRQIAFLSMFLLANGGCGKPVAGGSATASAPQAPQAPQAPTAPQAPIPPATERVVAEVGVGQKGRRLDQDHVVDAIARPAKVLFAFKEKAVFEFQIVPAMNYFRAEKGRAPKSHEEFMESIVKANAIQLPELPPGQSYVYDPATEQLMVERPVEAENRKIP